MSTYLLDINILLALTDPMHIHHEAAHKWFVNKGNSSWATCPLTENGFLRIASHPNYPNRPGDVFTVFAILIQLCDARGHEFWAEDTSIIDILEPNVVISHSQITDIYLAGLAVKKGGKLATFDRRIPVNAVIGGAGVLETINS